MASAVVVAAPHGATAQRTPLSHTQRRQGTLCGAWLLSSPSGGALPGAVCALTSPSGLAAQPGTAARAGEHMPRAEVLWPRLRRCADPRTAPCSRGLSARPPAAVGRGGPPPP